MAMGEVDRSAVGMFVRPTRTQARDANLLYERGANRDDIYGETGLIRDYDPNVNRWMTELSDEGASLRPDAITDNNLFQEEMGRFQSGDLGQLLDHPRLYDYDPSLRDLPVLLSEGENAFYAENPRVKAPGSYGLKLDLREAGPMGVDPLTIPLHEVQHALDFKDNAFAPNLSRGGSLNAISDDAAEGWMRDYKLNIRTMLRKLEDAYWKMDPEHPLRDEVKKQLANLQRIDTNVRNAPPEQLLREARHALYQRDPWEDRARRVMRRQGLSQELIDSRQWPPWLDLDVPEQELRMGPYTSLADYARRLEENPEHAASAKNDPGSAAYNLIRMMEYLKIAAAGGGLGLSVGAVRAALQDAMEAEDA